MKRPLPAPGLLPSARWSTSAFGAGADASPQEQSALREHFDQCSGMNRRWFRARCGVEVLQGFVAGRLVTLLVAVSLLIALAAAWW